MIILSARSCGCCFCLPFPDVMS